MSRLWSRRAFLRRAPLVIGATGAVATGAVRVGARPSWAATGAGSARVATAPIGAGAPVNAELVAATTSGAGIWVPPGWGQYVAPRLAAAKSGAGRVSVALIGDSLCRGFFSSDLDAKGWGGLVAGALRSSYGDGGSGFQSSADSAIWMSGVGGLAAPSTISFYQAAGNLVSTSGQWSAVTADYLGPSNVALKTTDPSATVTASTRGTTVRVFWLDGGPKAMGAFQVGVDGAAPVSVRPTGVYRINSASVSGLAAGTHTVVVTAAGATSTTPTAIIGVAGENVTGCLVNQFSRYGQTTAMLNNSDTLLSGTWNGGWQYAADLVVYALGANDAHSGLPADQWARNLRLWLAGAYDTAFGGSSTGAVDGILVLPHIGTYDNTTWVYQDYAARAREIAETFGLMLVDMWTAGRNSWNWWKVQPGGSYWANASSPGHGGSDGIHLSDLGHQYVASTVLGAITANMP